MTAPVDALRLARELIGIGRPVDAHRVLSEVLASDPDSGEALATLAYLHHSTGDLAAMLDAARRAAAADPDYAWAHRLLAIALIGQPRTGPVTEAALVAADRAVLLDPDVAAGHQVRAHALARRGDLVAAYRSAWLAVQLAPDEADPYATLSHVLGLAGERDAARAADRMALRLAPGSAGPHRAFAESATLAGRYRTAARTYRSLLATHPTEAGLSRAFEATLDWLQAVWSGLASLVTGAALVLYLTGVPQLPRGAAVAVLLVAWGAAYAYAHRGLAAPWWRYLRTREGTRREPRAALVALLVPLAAACLFGFAPPGLRPSGVAAAVLLFAVSMLMPIGFAVIHLVLRGRARTRRRRFRAALGGPPVTIRA